MSNMGDMELCQGAVIQLTKSMNMQIRDCSVDEIDISPTRPDSSDRRKNRPEMSHTHTDTFKTPGTHTSKVKEY